MTCAPDPLQAARDRLRRLHLNHEVDRAHVDAELERRRCNQTWDAPGLQLLLDDQALLARKRAVVRARDLLVWVAVVPVGVRELVQPECQTLGETPVVHEDDRRAVLADE